MRVRRALAVLPLMILPFPTLAQTAADRAWNAGEYATAERLYLERLATDSTDRTALHRVALIQAWSERYDSSVEYFDRLLQIDPDNSEATLDRARILGWSRRYAEALSSLQTLIERSPDNLQALQLRAQISGWAGEFTNAIAAYDRILELTPGDTEMTLSRARTLGWASRHDEAIEIYEALLRANPNDYETRLGLAQLLSWSGRLDSATAIYDVILRENPDDLGARRGLARVSTWGGELGKGEDQWREILADHRDDVEALVGLSQTLRWQGRHAAALESLSRAKAVSPTHPDVLTQEGWTRASINPRVAGSVSYVGDSDGNRILTSTFRTAFRPAPRVEISGSGYSRRAGFVSGFLPTRTSVGISGTVWTQFEPGWTVSATAGLSESNGAGARPITTVQLAFTTPVRNRFAFDGAFTRNAFDYTAALIGQGVYLREVRGGATVRLPRHLTVRTSVAHGVFVGPSNNHRTEAQASVSKRVTNPMTVTGNLHIFGFSDDVNEGYFDPGFYGLLEGVAAWQRTFAERWTLAAEAAPGLQKVEIDGRLGATVRASAGVTYRLLPGREIMLRGIFASTGIRSFSSELGTYRYRAITFAGNWRL